MGAEKILTTLVGLTKSSVEECNRLREEFEEVSWHKKGFWKTEELCPEQTETCSGNSEPCTRKNYLNSWLLDDVEDKSRRKEEDESRSQEKRSGGRKGKGRDQSVKASVWIVWS